MNPIGRAPNEPPEPINLPGSSEYGDTLSDVLKDQVRRKERRSAPAPTSARPRLHPGIPPILAIISIWLWAFPPAVLHPVVPSIPPANQEAGLRMEMYIQFNNIQRYLSEHGRLPNDLQEVGDSPDGVEYVPLAGSVFRLSGQTGDITVDFMSTEPLANLIADATAIVSGNVPSTPGGASAP